MTAETVDIALDGEITAFRRIRFETADPDVFVCHDCAAEHGEFHQPGCDCETCPCCKGQLLTCKCFTAPGFKLGDSEMEAA